MKYVLLLLCIVTRVLAQQHLAYESTQSIWLLNSNSTFASSEDSFIDRHFFEARTVTIQSLEPFPPDVQFECSAYRIDTSTEWGRNPQMRTSFTGPQFHQSLLNRMLSSKQDMLFLILVLGDKQGEEYKFVGTMKFRIKGEPKAAKKPKKKKAEEISLVNSNGKKVRMQDSVVSKKYFETDWVDLNLGHELVSEESFWVVVQPLEGEARAAKMSNTRLMETARLWILNAAIGTKVFFINQQPDGNQALLIRFVLIE